MKKTPVVVVVCILLVGLAAPCVAQQNARTLPRALDQLTAEASTIVQGSVISAKIEPHPQLKNLTTALITMKLAKTYKGDAQKTLTFRQYIWDLRAKTDPAGYYKGQELLLMLGPTSEYGLTSPVGLEQGRFEITRDRKGRATAVNGRGNAGLFRSSTQKATSPQVSPRIAALIQQNKSGPIALEDLSEAISAYVGRR